MQENARICNRIWPFKKKRQCEVFVSFYEVFGLEKKPHIEWPREHGLFGGGFVEKKLGAACGVKMQQMQPK
jgi:hypothetical protein